MNFITTTFNVPPSLIAEKRLHGSKTWLIIAISLILNYLMLIKYKYYSSQK